VLKYEPRRRHIVDQAEHFADQARLVAANAGHPTHLAEVGTGKTRRHHVGWGKERSSRMSPTTGASKRRLRTVPAGCQYSHSRSVSTPALLSPSSSPPMPEKSPTDLTKASLRKLDAESSRLASAIRGQGTST